MSNGQEYGTVNVISDSQKKRGGHGQAKPLSGVPQNSQRNLQIKESTQEYTVIGTEESKVGPDNKEGTTKIRKLTPREKPIASIEHIYASKEANRKNLLQSIAATNKKLNNRQVNQTIKKHESMQTMSKACSFEDVRAQFSQRESLPLDEILPSSCKPEKNLMKTLDFDN